MQPPLQLGGHVGRADHLGHLDPVVRVEADEVEAAERRGVLVLLADRLAAALDLDLAALLGEPRGRRVAALVGVQGVEQADREGAGGAEAGAAGRDVGHRGDLDAALDAQQAQRLAHQRVLDVRRAGDLLGARVADPHRRVELAADGDVDRLVDRRGEHRAAVAAIVGRQVGAAAEEADPQRRARDDHAALASACSAISSAAAAMSATTWSGRTS